MADTAGLRAVLEASSHGELLDAAEQLSDAVEDLLFTTGDPDTLRAAVRVAWQNYVSTVDLLALPYADRPGYRTEWAP